MFKVFPADNNLLYTEDGKTFISFCFIKNEAEAIRKYCSRIKTRIRSNPDFRYYMKTRKAKDAFRCRIYPNVTAENAVIELHHAPFSLYEIVEIVAYERILSGSVLPDNLLIHEIITLHFNNWVGYTSLCETAHQAVEKHEVPFSKDYIEGDVAMLATVYPQGFNALYQKKLTEWQQLSGDGSLVKLREMLTYTPVTAPMNKKLAVFIQAYSGDRDIEDYNPLEV